MTSRYGPLTCLKQSALVVACWVSGWFEAWFVVHLCIACTSALSVVWYVCVCVWQACKCNIHVQLNLEFVYPPIQASVEHCAGLLCGMEGQHLAATVCIVFSSCTLEESFIRVACQRVEGWTRQG